MSSESDVIVARQIVLKSPSGRSQIVLEASDKNAGLWISGVHPDGHMLALFSTDIHSGIAIYGRDQRRALLSVHLNRDGSSTVQSVNPETGELRLTNLATGATQVWAPDLPALEETQPEPIARECRTSALASS